MEFLSWIFWRLGYRLLWDKPYFIRDPEAYHGRPILEDVHTKPLGDLLRIGAPRLFEQWYNSVLYSAYAVGRTEKEIGDLRKKKEAAAKKVGALEAELNSQPRVNHSPDEDIPARQEAPKPKFESWEKLLTVGLSLMLFLGLSNMLGLDLRSMVFPEDLPTLVFSGLGAVCLNIAEYKSIYRMAFVSRRFESRHIYDKNDRHPKSIPFWHRFKSGDPAVWISLAFILMETLFAFLGLLSLLTPQLQTQFLPRLAVFASAGLAATINLTLAWGDALISVQAESIAEEYDLAHRQLVEAYKQREEYETQRNKYWNKKEKLDGEKQEIDKRLGEAHSELAETIEQLKILEGQLPDLKVKALLEHERWELDVRKWIRDNPTKVENFKQLYPEWNPKTDIYGSNGHRPSRQDLILPMNDPQKVDEDISNLG